MTEMVPVSGYKIVDTRMNRRGKYGAILLHHNDGRWDDSKIGVAHEISLVQQIIESVGMAGTNQMPPDLRDRVWGCDRLNADQLPKLKEAILFAIRSREENICVEIDSD